MSPAGFASITRLERDLSFTNRAQCALDSKKPTTEVLVLLSNMDIGRSLYRLAKIRNLKESSEFTKLGLNKYRYTVLSLLDIIHKKILNNTLPLLPSDLSVSSNLSKYSEISKRCSQISHCPELDKYISALWDQSNNKGPFSDEIDPLLEVNFLNVELKNKNKNLSCAYLKKFTPLEAHLFGTKPSAEVLEQIAKASKDVNDYYSDCYDYNAQESLKVSTYEFSFNLSNSKIFEKIGFDYWNSMKIYFSWAFRNSKEAAQLAYPFDEVFSSVQIEDSLFMMPNGCKSLVHPKCDPATINQNSIRLFAKHDFKQSSDSLDFFRSIPEGATKNMLEDPFSVVNQDILNFSQFETADKWTDSFRQNFSETRLTMRKKFVSAIGNMSLMSKQLNEMDIKTSLSNYFKPVLKNETKDNTILKSELYYLCAESTFLSSEELSYLKPKIEILSKLNITDDLTGTINGQSIIEIFDYYKTVIKSVNELCGSFDQSLVFDPSFQVDKSGFNRWYIDSVYEGKFLSLSNLTRKEKLKAKKPMLAYQLFSSSNDIKDVICIDSVDCARIAIQSIVDLYGVIQYSQLFLDIKNEINSSNMLNPYAERTACKVYDPWFKTKASLFGFATDFIQGAVSAVTPGLIYGNFDLQPGRVVSFNQLVKEGKINVDPRYEKTKIISSVALDLGSMTNVPCSISISKSKKLDPVKLLSFKGLTIRTCRENEKNVLNVDSKNELGQNLNKYNNTCLQCSLDFEHVSSAISTAIPFGRTAFFMARSVIRLYKGMKDPINVPKSWQVNPYLTKLSFESNENKIPTNCLSKLLTGKACMKNSCEDSIVNAYKSNDLYLESIDSTDSWLGSVQVTLKNCKKPTKVKVSYQRNEDGSDSCYLSPKNIISQCSSNEEQP